MPAFLDKLKAKPWVAHLIRTAERFTNRLGSQFAAAITYFSVLAMVPLLLLAFSILGFVLTVLYPEVIDEVTVAVTDALGGVDPETQANLSALITEYLQNWRGVGIVALVAALYSGAGWMGNLKNAVRAQWRPDFDLQEAQGNIVKKTVVNLVLLLGLIVLIAITFALASVSTALTGTVLDALGLTHIGWLRPVLHFVPIIFSIGAGWLLFMYLFSVLPEDREPWPIVRRGALMGAVGLAVLQYAAGLLIAAFQNNKAAQLFGPVIVLMLFLNIFAQLILFIAAWIATARHEAISVPEEKVRFALTPESERDADTDADDDTGAAPTPSTVSRSWCLRRSPHARYRSGSAPVTSPAQRPGSGWVRRWPGWSPRPSAAAASRSVSRMMRGGTVSEVDAPRKRERGRRCSKIRKTTRTRERRGQTQ